MMKTKVHPRLLYHSGADRSPIGFYSPAPNPVAYNTYWNTPFQSAHTLTVGR